MPPFCPWCLRTTEEGLEVTPHQDGDEAAPDLKTEVGTPQGCHPRHGEIKCSLLYPVCRMLSLLSGFTEKLSVDFIQQRSHSIEL